VRAGDGRPPRGGSEEYFETVAGEWEALRSSFFPDALRGLICDRAAVGAGALAVDVGAGSGFLSVELLARGDVLRRDQRWVLGIGWDMELRQNVAANLRYKFETRTSRHPGKPFNAHQVDFGVYFTL